MLRDIKFEADLRKVEELLLSDGDKWWIKSRAENECNNIVEKDYLTSYEKKRMLSRDDSLAHGVKLIEEMAFTIKGRQVAAESTKLAHAEHIVQDQIIEAVKKAGHAKILHNHSEDIVVHVDSSRFRNKVYTNTEPQMFRGSVSHYERQIHVRLHPDYMDTVVANKIMIVETPGKSMLVLSAKEVKDPDATATGARVFRASVLYRKRKKGVSNLPVVKGDGDDFYHEETMYVVQIPRSTPGEYVTVTTPTLKGAVIRVRQLSRQIMQEEMGIEKCKPTKK